jgi:hypothetical protein
MYLVSCHNLFKLDEVIRTQNCLQYVQCDENIVVHIVVVMTV